MVVNGTVFLPTSKIRLEPLEFNSCTVYHSIQVFVLTHCDQLCQKPFSDLEKLPG